MSNNRTSARYHLILPIDLSFGTQITLQGQLKDISLKSAFVNVRSSIHMAVNDEVGFTIPKLPHAQDVQIQGSARISRVSKGEGIAIYFTKIDESSTEHLQKLIGV